MDLRSTWQRYIAWRRGQNARYSAIPRWQEGQTPLVGFAQLKAPELEPGEQPVLASLATLSGGWWSNLGQGYGALWLTDRRLIFHHQRFKFSFAPSYIELRREEIAQVGSRSILRSLLSIPFLGSFEVRTQAGKRYVFQAWRAGRWVEEINATIVRDQDV